MAEAMELDYLPQSTVARIPLPMTMTKADFLSEYEMLLSDRTEWEEEWKKVQTWLLPNRGVFMTNQKTKKRKASNPNVINDVGREALRDLVSIMQGGLTSRDKPWFKLKFLDDSLNTVKPLIMWLEDCEKVMYEAFAYSNFYGAIDSFFTEYAGFGVANMYVGEDGDPFRFEQLTAGEYAFAMDANQRVVKMFRTIYSPAREVVEEFGFDNVSQNVKSLFESKPEEWVTIIHVVYPIPFLDRPFYSCYFELGSSHTDSEFLIRRPQNEMPFVVGRWEAIGTDLYSSCPGMEAVPHIKRLQEMEKAFLIAAHKDVNPPLNAPVTKMGTVKTMPGGINYYSSPNETVNSVYQLRFNYDGVANAIQRVEQRIKEKFYNDILLSTTRDPNLSPLKAAEVDVRDRESLLRIGPVIGRSEYEVLEVTIERSFNILARKGLFPPIDPRYQEMIAQSGLGVKFVSMLSQAQKSIMVRPMNTFLGMVQGVMQFEPTVKDKINPDTIVDEYADFLAVPTSILNTDDEVRKIRQDRAAALKARQEAEERAANAAVTGAELENQQTEAEIAQTISEAGVNTQEIIQGAPVGI